MNGMVAILPLLSLLIYLLPLVLLIWFAVTFLKQQKERNELLREISRKIDIGEGR
ncbi:hypothetical protein NCCP2716_11660 [Sporosarcina sp. NCCP-2716]|uniref:hypothetical protein n=1 Tax=Sporosarcina sp. NCCP-2716 TaxID=2943679 RepID=UPI00203D5944|nr:hypothetical protein [Sporosarcina sp. NCCP-2716]GKV68668.1 hypothetical protein NCCP2716_11660 [Sporosarcina sp. NCCP-2716]